MPVPNASYSITMRVQLDADPGGIGRLTTAVGEAGGAVTAVDVVESHHDRMVVDLTCNARGTDHAEQIAKAVDRLQGVETRKVSDRNLTFLHATFSPDEEGLAQRAACGVGRQEGGGNPGRRATSLRTDEQAASVHVGGRLAHYAQHRSPRR